MTQVLFSPDFFDSLTRLQPAEQVRANQFIVQFQANPAHPSISLERLNTKSGEIWSGRITQELRAILYKEGDTWALLHAGHHDPAYAWAERREVRRHTVTGALQMVNVEEVDEVRTRLIVQHQVAIPPRFEAQSDEYLLSLGVPEAWLPAIREIRTDDELLEVAGRLPAGVGERLLDVAAGRLVTPPPPEADAPLAAAPETRRAFFVPEDEAELKAALAAPLERWITFLHPSQRRVVESSASGPMKVTGSAGTGKTVVALHRARHLAREGHRVLLTSYVTTLCENLGRSLDVLVEADARPRITVSTVHSEVLRLARLVDGRAHPVGEDRLKERLRAVVARRGDPDLDPEFVWSEWANVIQARGLASWPEYRSVQRTGRGSGLSVRQRKDLWDIFEEVRDVFRAGGGRSWSDLCTHVAGLLRDGSIASDYTAVIVDEVQDLGAAEIRFLRDLAGAGTLLLTGDAGQRIYPGGFSLRALGIETRGRSHILRVNYRTTEQIRLSADRMLGGISDDLDGEDEDRSQAVSLRRGPAPRFVPFESRTAEWDGVVSQVRRWLDEGIEQEGIALFLRSNRLIKPLERKLLDSGIPVLRLTKRSSLQDPGVRVGTMHRAKGLEFRCVGVAGVDAGTVPPTGTEEGEVDPLDVEEANARERRLLYVAMTRARDELVVSWTGAPSPFLEPLLDDGVRA